MRSKTPCRLLTRVGGARRRGVGPALLLAAAAAAQVKSIFNALRAISVRVLCRVCTYTSSLSLSPSSLGEILLSRLLPVLVPHLLVGDSETDGKGGVARSCEGEPCTTRTFGDSLKRYCFPCFPHLLLRRPLPSNVTQIACEQFHGIIEMYIHFLAISLILPWNKFSFLDCCQS